MVKITEFKLNMRPNFSKLTYSKTDKSAINSSKNEPWITSEQIDIKDSFTKEDVNNLHQLNFAAGIAPNLRGPYSTMYVMRPWTIRQYAGFSTAEIVTQISGRGVGMDVVSSEIKQMGGVIEIDSVQGKGSTFTIKLPFTVSVNHALMVEFGDEVFAVPLANIEGIVRVSRLLRI